MRAANQTSAANLARLRAGTLRVRQRPGPRNALGLAKFVFPNVQNVYLHDTPGRSLFTRARRDFSHGCVRVEDPVGLAVWVLDADGGWGREQVLAAMHSTNNRHVPGLKAPTVSERLYQNRTRPVSTCTKFEAG